MLNKPKILYLELTNRCNANCIMCSHSQMKREPYDMPYSLAIKTINEVNPDRLILHLFGESLLYPFLEQVIYYASRNKIRTLLDTNGFLLNKRRFVNLSKCGLNDIVLSFGSVTKEVYESIWKGLDYKTVINNIITAYRTREKYNLKTKIQIRPIITRENKHQLKNIIALWGNFCDVIKPVDEFHLYQHDRMKVDRTNKPSCKDRRRLFKECAVKSNGDIILCCNDLDGDFVMGNLNENSFLEIWNGDKFNDFRSRINEGYNIPEICKECVIRND